MDAVVEAIHEADSLKDNPLIIHIQLGADLEHPIHDRRSQMARYLPLPRHQILKLTHILAIDHVVVAFSRIAAKVGQLLRSEELHGLDILSRLPLPLN